MILTYGESKVGLVRKVNEDAISLSVPDVYLLADGMGGYDGGQLASRLCRRGFFPEKMRRTGIGSAHEGSRTGGE